jgi:hypothetical protein
MALHGREAYNSEDNNWEEKGFVEVTL